MAVTGNLIRVVVFGGIGSGKSTLTALLANKGAVIIEADRIGHAILRSDGAAFSAVSGRWPQTVTNGEIDRSALGKIVFADRRQLSELEAITHPLIAAEIHRQAQAAGSDPVIVELPLARSLVGDGWTWVLVEAPTADRLQRAIDRGASEEDVRSRMAAQSEDDGWHERADWIVPNTGSIEELAAAAAELWEHLGGR